MTDEQALDALPEVNWCTGTPRGREYIEVAPSHFAAVGLADPTQLRRVVEWIGGWVDWHPAKLGGSGFAPEVIEPESIGYVVPRSAFQRAA